MLVGRSVALCCGFAATAWLLLLLPLLAGPPRRVERPAAAAARAPCRTPASCGGYYVAASPLGSASSPARRGALLELRLAAPQLPELGPDFDRLELRVAHEAPQRLHVTLAPAGRERWQVPEWLVPRPPQEDFSEDEALYDVRMPRQGEPFSLTALRRPPGGVRGNGGGGGGGGGDAAAAAAAVFDTAGSRLVFKDQYLEFSTAVPEGSSLYGLGQHVQGDGGGLALPRDGRNFTLWNRGSLAFKADGSNQYGSHPFLLRVDADGRSSGLLLLNSNGMDVQVGGTSVTFRAIGGLLDLYVFLGPSPEEVARQYHAAAGRPAMPPMWALGLHQSRWGYRTLGHLRDAVEGHRRAGLPLEALHMDIDHMDRFRDFTLDPERFPANETAAFAESLRRSGQRLVAIVDCGIPAAPDDRAYAEGLEAGAFLLDRSGRPYLGQVWPGATAYPDFLSREATWPWWRRQLQRLHDQVPVSGVWIDMNEPVNFCTGEACEPPGENSTLHRLMTDWSFAAQLAAAGSTDAGASFEGQQQQQQPHEATRAYSKGERRVMKMFQRCQLRCTQPGSGDALAFPPYAIHNGVPHEPPPPPGGGGGSARQRRRRRRRGRPLELGRGTVAVTATGADGRTRQYDSHNLYGLGEAAATHSAMRAITRRRPFVLTRSTFPGSGRFAAHWTGDNGSSWPNLRWSVPALISSNLWGMPLSGSDICGFAGTSDEELCARWASAGAFYGLSRNHNALGSRAPQEFYRWPAAASAARRAFAARLSLLPHLYAAFFEAHARGGTVARPLLSPFPADAEARAVDDQWMLGGCVLVSPVLHQGAEARRAYFPAATWYGLDLPGGPSPGGASVQGPAHAVLRAPLGGGVPLHLRGGSVLALQRPGNTTAATAPSPVRLLVALDRTPPPPPPPGGGVEGGGGAAQEAEAAAPPPRCRDLLAAAGELAGDAVAFGSALPTPEGGPGGEALAACGLLYLDGGESLDVPDAEGGHLLALLVATARPGGGGGGRLRVLPARGSGPGGSGGGGGGSSGYVAPPLEEVTVLGLDAVGGGGGGGGSEGLPAFEAASWGEPLAAASVSYDAAARVLRLTGLRLPLGEGADLEWWPARRGAPAGVV